MTNSDFMPEKILVMLLAGAGDILLTTPMLKELRNIYPHAVIDVVVMQGPAAENILSGNPNIDSVICHDFIKASKSSSLKFCMHMRRRQYECILLPAPHNRLAYNMIAWLMGGKKRIGFEYAIKCGSMSKIFLTNLIREDVGMHLVKNNLRVISESLGVSLHEKEHKLELFPDEDNKNFANVFLNDHNLHGHKLVGIHPGSGHTKNLVLKRWEPEKWAAVARMLVEDHNTRILIFGGREEFELKELIVASSGLSSEKIVDVNARTVLDLAELVRKCTCVVSGDTLIPHVSAAVGTPAVVIYGPTSHLAAYPYQVEHSIVRAGLECSPCYGFSRYGIRCTNDVHLNCLKTITVEMVMNSIKDLL